MSNIVSIAPIFEAAGNQEIEQEKDYNLSKLGADDDVSTDCFEIRKVKNEICNRYQRSQCEISLKYLSITYSVLGSPKKDLVDVK